MGRDQDVRKITRQVVGMVKYERRYLDRIKIPGAEIKYAKNNGDSATVELIDLTKISVRFFSNHEFGEGELINLTILVKGHARIQVNGNIVWTHPTEENDKYKSMAVVQFLPFGTDERYNSLKSYELLAELEEKYSKNDNITKNIYRA